MIKLVGSIANLQYNKDENMDAMSIIGFVFALAALAYANKSKADIVKLQHDIALLKARMDQGEK